MDSEYLSHYCEVPLVYARPNLDVVGKGATVYPNASTVYELGAGVGSLVNQLLDGDPYVGSSYEGRYVRVTVNMAIPVSTWDDDANEWVRTGTEYKVVDRLHQGTDYAVDQITAVDWIDTVTNPPALGPDESYRFGDNDTANAGFVTPYPVDLDATSIDFGYGVDAAALFGAARRYARYVDGDTSAGMTEIDWQDYGAIAGKATNISSFGHGAAGAIFEQYETDWPAWCEFMETSHGFSISALLVDENVTYPDRPYGVPMWDTSKDLEISYDYSTADHETDTVTLVMSEVTKTLEWVPGLYRWATYQSMDYTSNGWTGYSPSSGSAGTVRIYGLHDWELYVEPKFLFPKDQGN